MDCRCEADGQMGGRAGGRTGGRADGQTGGRAGERTGGRADERTSGRTGERAGGQADRRTAGQADGRTGGPADGRTGGRTILSQDMDWHILWDLLGPSTAPSLFGQRVLCCRLTQIAFLRLCAMIYARRPYAFQVSMVSS